MITSIIIIGKRTSSGARHWVDVHYYTDPEACFRHVRSICEQVFATHLGVESRSLHAIDFTRPTALIFGNERAGIGIETGASPLIRRNHIYNGKEAGVFYFDGGMGTFEENVSAATWPCARSLGCT